MAFFARNTLLLSGSASLVLGLGGTAMSETVAAVGTTTLPGITVIRPEQSAQPSRRPKKRAVAQRRRVTTAASPPPTREQSPPPTQEQVSQTQQQVVAGQNEKFDETRRNIDTPIGATSYQVTHQNIEALPQGTNTALDKVLLQFPGVTQDSAASGELHVRNEHANLQYRINGIMLPDGVGAFGQILDTGIVGSLALLTGALPAQYGLRTAGWTPATTLAASAFTAAATAPSHPASNMAAPSDKPSISCPVAFCKTIWE
jgi:hypothetical protein